MAYLAAMARTPATHHALEKAATQNTGPHKLQGSCAVLVSIHQPRAAIWDMFDKVRSREDGAELCVVEGGDQKARKLSGTCSTERIAVILPANCFFTRLAGVQQAACLCRQRISNAQRPFDKGAP